MQTHLLAVTPSRSSYAWIFLALFLFAYPHTVQSEDAFETFDGKVYNGKYYPRIDIIEWGTPSHMEFHVYWKGKPLDMSFLLDTKTGRKVMMVNYHIAERNEHLCRRVLAPGHFHDNFYVYKDSSDPDFDNILVSVDKLPEKPGMVMVSNPVKYAACGTEEPSRSLSSTGKGKEAGLPPGDRTKVDESAIKSKDGSVPFSDW